MELARGQLLYAAYASSLVDRPGRLRWKQYSCMAAHDSGAPPGGRWMLPDTESRVAPVVFRRTLTRPSRHRRPRKLNTIASLKFIVSSSVSVTCMSTWLSFSASRSRCWQQKIMISQRDIGAYEHRDSMTKSPLVTQSVPRERPSDRGK